MASTLKVDLNCDLGESFGRYTLGQDEEMMKWITSANIACGFHADDPTIMAKTVSLAKHYGVNLGAHPGYPDLQGFGRRQLGMTLDEISNMLIYQIGALEGLARLSGGRLVHIKPHGALYNLAAQNSDVANTIAQGVQAYNSGLILVGLAGSELTRAGQAVGLRIAQEGFPDRTYLPDGHLMPRSQKGAVITEPKAVAANALSLVREGIRIEGVHFTIDTLCLHGDNPHALENAQQVRSVLSDAGIEIRALESSYAA